MTEQSDQPPLFDLDEPDETLNLAVYPDDPPSSGDWVDIDEVIANPTEEEIAEGQRLGEEIDPDDDDSTGVEVPD